MNWQVLVPWLLLTHVLAAIVAIGPNFAYSTIRGMGRKEPQHANFATRVSHTISDRLVYPVGLVIPPVRAGHRQGSRLWRCAPSAAARPC